MPARLRLALAVATALAAAALVAVLATALLRDEAAGTPPEGELAGAVAPAELPPVDFRLRDQRGRTVDARDLRGEVVVMTFIYTTCEETCPLQARLIGEALDELDRPARVVAVSVDPPQDTPRNASRFLLEHRMAGRMDVLLGSREELEPVWKRFGIRPQGDGFEHTAHVFVIDAEGRQRVGFPVNHPTPEGLAHDIRVLQDEAGGRAAAS